MILSDVSVKRPVLACVFGLILIAFGLVSFDRLPLREYPDIDPPIVSIDTTYVGASADIVESRITETLEERISGVEGIKYISSVSKDGESRITIEFNIDRDVDAAANDIRDRISGVLDNLPEEADPPETQKVDSSDDVIMWLNLTSDNMTVPELTDYADRYLVDRFSVLDGVARVRIGGAQNFAMRIWLDRKAMAAKNVTVTDIENAIRTENLELPAGNIESKDRLFIVRVDRAFKTAKDFSNLVIRRGEDGYLLRLRDVARVEKGVVENRTFFRGNEVPMVGLGVIKQSTANTVDVARLAREKAAELNETLPDGMSIAQSYDSSVFIEGAINEVYKTLGIAIMAVIFVIYLFLGSFRSMIVPAVTVPISVIATFIVLLMLDFSVNLLTLLALVLAIGMVVDDAIVVLENIVRRIKELHETPLVAAYRGTRQVGFAVIATTLVLISVFVPIAFLQGDIGRLFSEFALTMAAAVGFSSFVALTVSPMLASVFLKDNIKDQTKLTKTIDDSFHKARGYYEKSLSWALNRWIIVTIGFVAMLILSGFLFTQIPSEYAPKEDRGAFFIMVSGPEGASFDYMDDYMNEIERRLMPFAESGEFKRLLVRAPRGFGNIAAFNGGIVIVILDDWGKRKSADFYMAEARKLLGDLPGVRAFPIMRQGFGGSLSKPVQFVIGGGDSYEQLAEWRDILVQKVNENNPGLVGLDWDYKETQPQMEVEINYKRASELGVRVADIGNTLQTMFGSKQVTTYLEGGEEYDVLVEGERDLQRSQLALKNVYTRSETSGKLIPLSNLVSVRELADSSELNRYNRIRSITLEANLAEGYVLGDALDYLNQIVDENLPENVIVDYKGQSQDYQESGSEIFFVFMLGLAVTFLVLAGQFESFIHPFIIMLTVPMAVAGGLIGLYLTGNSLNIYSQIGLIMLVGLAAKNGILIVEFVNQLRDEGYEFGKALIEASTIRFRPILMTSITTIVGSVPLVLSSGAGAETRMVIGVVVLAGVLVSTFLTLFVVPVAYNLLARHTTSPLHTQRQLEKELEEHDKQAS
tara:strand:- start:3223 stop:6345 length:3123 start_codon:yes stop_codon:yes gene_type:complete